MKTLTTLFAAAALVTVAATAQAAPVGGNWNNNFGAGSFTDSDSNAMIGGQAVVFFDGDKNGNFGNWMNPGVLGAGADALDSFVIVNLNNFAGSARVTGLVGAAAEAESDVYIFGYEAGAIQAGNLVAGFDIAGAAAHPETWLSAAQQGFTIVANPLITGGSYIKTIVPEPASLALLGLGGIAALRRRK